MYKKIGWRAELTTEPIHPPEALSEEDPFALVYAMSPVAGRNFVPVVVDDGKPVADRSSRLKAKQQGHPTRIFIFVSQKDYSRDEARAICEKLVDALNRWPEMNSTTKRQKGQGDQLATRTLFLAAQHFLFPEKPVRWLAPILKRGGGTLDFSLSAELPSVDPVSLKVVKTRWMVGSSKLDRCIELNQHSENVIFTSGGLTAINLTKANQNVTRDGFEMPSGLEAATESQARWTDEFLPVAVGASFTLYHENWLIVR